jgi:hypothetical protein
MLGISGPSAAVVVPVLDELELHAASTDASSAAAATDASADHGRRECGLFIALL